MGLRGLEHGVHTDAAPAQRTAAPEPAPPPACRTARSCSLPACHRGTYAD